jgi:hypothetical protein
LNVEMIASLELDHRVAYEGEASNLQVSALRNIVLQETRTYEVLPALAGLHELLEWPR